MKLKHKLHPRALYSTHSYDLHNPPSATDIVLERAGEKVKAVDPNGDRALALLSQFGPKSRK